ncbi:GNAT family N-acetyltransferase [Calothrix sp. UHCC 0171]|uniref:GNAT family N-acetyltransferase n=1 Tax=Calothrix sp. UHCC 0171 TaxID=3110245 RepID=UPI002B1FB4FB|nr:GNAT family N-acetyltransferase [Calothrix sp. UHCC 0171]MEA5571536.1 GNAT family N-acetyltransferase [Calothrix sp. UHCC 0171]
MNFQTPWIICDRIILRMANNEDIPQILNYFIQNKTYLTPYYPAWYDEFFTEEYWQLQIDVNYQEFNSDRSLRLFIFLQNNPNQIIGTLNFNNFVRGVAQYCNVGYSLAENEQGKGYMTVALQGAIQYMFQEVKMHRISANYMPHNRRSGNLLKRLGFVVEGYARDYLMINGKWEDHVLTSLVNSQWLFKG